MNLTGKDKLTVYCRNATTIVLNHWKLFEYIRLVKMLQQISHFWYFLTRLGGLKLKVLLIIKGNLSSIYYTRVRTVILFALTHIVLRSDKEIKSLLGALRNSWARLVASLTVSLLKDHSWKTNLLALALSSTEFFSDSFTRAFDFHDDVIDKSVSGIF